MCKAQVSFLHSRRACRNTNNVFQVNDCKQWFYAKMDEIHHHLFATYDILKDKQHRSNILIASS